MCAGVASCLPRTQKQDTRGGRSGGEETRVHEETLRGERFLFTRAVGLRVLARALMTCELLESTSAGGNVSLTPPHEYGY